MPVPAGHIACAEKIGFVQTRYDVIQNEHWVRGVLYSFVEWFGIDAHPEISVCLASHHKA